MHMDNPKELAKFITEDIYISEGKYENEKF
jgi:hypothetical protein